MCAAHTHTPYGTPWSASAEPFRMICQEAIAFFDDHGVFEDDEVDVQSTDGGKRIAAALGEGRGVILRNHGLLTVGNNVDEAIGWFLMIERVAEVHVKAHRRRADLRRGCRRRAAVDRRPCTRAGTRSTGRSAPTVSRSAFRPPPLPRSAPAPLHPSRSTSRSRPVRDHPGADHRHAGGTRPDAASASAGVGGDARRRRRASTGARHRRRA